MSRRDVREDVLLAVATVAYLVAITVSYATTTMQSRLFIEPVRLAGMVIALGSVVAWMATRRRYAAEPLAALVLYGLLASYGLLLAVYNLGFQIVSASALQDTAVTAMGILVLGTAMRTSIMPAVMKIFIAYVVAVLAATYLTGGIVLGNPPGFVYEYASIMSNKDVAYSQGVSKFYGFGAASAIVAAFHAKKSRIRSFYICISIGMLAISFLGGGRGDTVAAVLIVSGYAALRARLRVIPWMIAIGGAVFVLYRYVNPDDITALMRFAELRHNLGGRDVLAAQSTDLLAENPVCLAVGCGFGFFQRYYGYEYGMYPHNVLLESAIVWGVPAVVLVFAAVVVGVAVSLKRNPQGVGMVVFLAYSFLILMKSGTVYNAWLFVALASYHGAVGVLEVFKRGAREKPHW